MKPCNILIALVIQVLATTVATTSSSGNTNYDKICETIPDLGERRDKGMAWVLSQRNKESGWVDTVGVVTALQLTNASSWNIPNSQRDLSIKQMTIEITQGLNNNDPYNPLTAGTVAKYANGAMSTCKNPRNYYANNLIATLINMTARYPFESSYQVLALCNAGVKIHQSITEQLQIIIENNKEPLFPQDTTAITIMALTCVQNQNGLPQTKLNQYVKDLGKTQKPDGSFGNIYSTTIVVQALLPFPDTEFSWSAINATNFLLNQQKQDGSFGNLGATIGVLPILSGHSLVNIPHLECTNTDNTSSTVHPSIRSTPGETTYMKVGYALWVGDNVDEAFGIKLTVPSKSSVYEIMLIAQETNGNFKFTADETVYGHFVTSINGIRNNATATMAWMFGTLIDGDKQEINFAPTGVDNFYPEDNDTIVFWYKKYSPY